MNYAEEAGIDGGTGGPTLDWVSLSGFNFCEFRIVISFSLPLFGFFVSLFYKNSLSLFLYHSATDDDMKIHIENSGKKISFFAKRHRLSIMKFFIILYTYIFEI